MKKTIKLTESELISMIEKIVNESKLETINENELIRHVKITRDEDTGKIIKKEIIYLAEPTTINNIGKPLHYDEETGLSLSKRQEIKPLAPKDDDNVMENYKNKKEKWIQKAIKKPGSLKKSMGKKKGEKIRGSELDVEMAKLKKKDKDPNKKGIQGLPKGDLLKLRKINLAKTLKGLKK